jgi:hypothetical protein
VVQCVLVVLALHARARIVVRAALRTAVYHAVAAASWRGDNLHHAIMSEESIYDADIFQALTKPGTAQP